MRIFRNDRERRRFLDILRTEAEKAGIDFWGWCLMGNHTHLVAVPRDEHSLARGIGETHRKFAREINLRAGVRGHLFQERFHSFPIQEDRYLSAVVRYVERNPVRAGIVKKPELYAWSSARHHLCGAPDPLITASPILDMFPDWRGFHAEKATEKEIERIRLLVASGRPLGSDEWLRSLEERLGVTIIPRTGGRPRGSKDRKRRRKREN